MPRTLGILGGMGPAATVNFLRLLVAEFNAFGIYDDVDFPRMLMLSLPLEEWDHRGAIDKATVREQVLSGIDWLKAAGADIIAVPCNSVSEFTDGDKSVVSIVDETLKLVKPGVIGVLCSAQAREAKLYEKRGRAVQYYPTQSSVDNIIYSVIHGMRCDIGMMINAEFAECASIVLGCTELSLCSFSRVGGKHIIDSSSALAKAVVRRV